jgi:hypothetical protein
MPAPRGKLTDLPELVAYVLAHAAGLAWAYAVNPMIFRSLVAQGYRDHLVLAAFALGIAASVVVLLLFLLLRKAVAGTGAPPPPRILRCSPIAGPTQRSRPRVTATSNGFIWKGPRRCAGPRGGHGLGIHRQSPDLPQPDRARDSLSHADRPCDQHRAIHRRAAALPVPAQGDGGTRPADLRPVTVRPVTPAGARRQASAACALRRRRVSRGWPPTACPPASSGGC